MHILTSWFSFLCYVGIAYQLPGAVASERAIGLTAHMKAMGLLDSARIMSDFVFLDAAWLLTVISSSWHLSISLIYLPAWVIVSIVWHSRIFVLTNVGLVLAVHVLLGLILASWSFVVAAPFGKSPQLAAIANTFLSIVFVIIALVMKKAGNGSAVVFSIIFPPGFYVFAIRAIAGYENNLQPTNTLKGDPDNNLILLPLLIAAIVSSQFSLQKCPSIFFSR